MEQWEMTSMWIMDDEEEPPLLNSQEFEELFSDDIATPIFASGNEGAPTFNDIPIDGSFEKSMKNRDDLRNTDVGPSFDVDVDVDVDLDNDGEYMILATLYMILATLSYEDEIFLLAIIR